MTRVRIRKTGEVLYLRGGPPSLTGDEFQTVCFPEEPPDADPPQSVYSSIDGVTAFTCRRGSTWPLPPQATRTFRYDPKLHELLP